MSSSGQNGPAIQLQHVWKKYALYERPVDRLLELSFLRQIKLHRDFWALQDFSVEADRGTTLGVLGRNGSGKSTLLQVLAGILLPTRGSCRVEGKVAALLELGAGFNPEFTGRENVFVNGAILGLQHRDIEERLDGILEFAEIGEFVDQPVKTYSSGMFMRLAFAVAVHVDPEILLVDEALAVGDMVFQHRCIHRMRQLRDSGKTIVFVTHDLHAVTSFCDRAVLLEDGRKVVEGSPETVVQRYQALVARKRQSEQNEESGSGVLDQHQDLPVINTIPYIHNRYGEGGAHVIGIIILSSQGEVINSVRGGQECQLLISVRFEREMVDPIVGFAVRDRLGNEMASSNSTYEGLTLPAARQDDVFTVRFQIQVPPLRPGSYTISPAVSRGDVWDHTVEDWIDNACVFDLIDTGLVYGQMRWPVKVQYRVSRQASDQTITE